MSSGKPDVILRKYRSILFSALAVELTTFIVSLLDPIIAGNRIGIGALSAISLFSPFISFSTFVAAVINTGTLVNYTLMIGKFQKKRANEIFSQGMIMAVSAGVMMTLIILLVKPLFISSLSPPAEVEGYLNRYYNIAAFYPLLFPTNCILNNIIVTEGGEKHAAISNICCIVGNIIFSFRLAGIFGIMGIAAATLASNVVFSVLLVIWLFIKKSNVRFVFHFSFEDFFCIAKCGIVKASKFVAASIMLWSVNLYILRNYDEVTFKVWTIDQNIIGLSSVFLGLAMTLQPIIGTLLGEMNTKAIKLLVHHLMRDLAVIGVGCSALIICFTGTVLKCFGVADGDVFGAGITALRITSLTIVFSALTAAFFIYYILVGRQLLAFVIGLLTDLLCPMSFVLLSGTLCKGSPDILWIAIAASGLIAFLLSAVIVFLRCKQSSFPLLLPLSRDEQIHIFSFEITAKNSSEMAKITEKMLLDNGFSKRLQLLVSVCIEDMLGLILEHNPTDSRRLYAECTLIIGEGSVQVIIRDTGKQFDLSDLSTEEHSFLQYIVERLMTVTDHSAYISTTGYNRNEMVFKENKIS